VAEEMPGRTGQQCAQRWRHKVNPNIRKDKWSDDEDAKVRAHIARHRPETARTH
jgi:myb proto-oncogene protein